MIYIELEENNKIEIKDEKKGIKRRILEFLNKIKSKTGKIKEEKIEDKLLIKLPDIENKTLNNLSKYIKQNCICRVCISDELLEDEVFMEFIKKENLRIFNGKWLFKILSSRCVDYIVKNKNENLVTQEVAILSNKLDDIVVYTIRELAEKVKVIDILTKDPYKFRKIEQELYKKGIIVNMSNNYKKSLLKSDIILNFDFSEIDFNNYALPQKACIINFENYINIKTKKFEGINISFVEITMPQKYLRYLVYFKKFNILNLYESFIFKNTNPNNIIREINADNVRITFLLGKNGKIRKNEYLKMSKKMVN